VRRSIKETERRSGVKNYSVKEDPTDDKGNEETSEKTIRHKLEEFIRIRRGSSVTGYCRNHVFLFPRLVESHPFADILGIGICGTVCTYQVQSLPTQQLTHELKITYHLNLRHPPTCTIEIPI
jgi:hypothetical protein